MQEWDLHPSVWSEAKEPMRTDYTQFAHSKPGLYFKCCASRLSGFFIWNIMFVMVSLTDPLIMVVVVVVVVVELVVG